VEVIEQARESGEAFVADELLVVNAPVFLAEHLMSLARDPPECVIDRHELS
jgi:hypothetical protein